MPASRIEIELVGGIIQDPANEQLWSVYRDWLLESGHPRGDFLAVSSLADSGNSEARWRIWQILSDERSLVGDELGAHLDLWNFDWRRGFVIAAEYCGGAVDFSTGMSALMGDLYTRLVERLVIHQRDAEPGVRLQAPQSSAHELIVDFMHMKTLSVAGIPLRAISSGSATEVSLSDVSAYPCIGGTVDLPRVRKLELDVREVDHSGPWRILEHWPMSLAYLEVMGATAGTVRKLLSSNALGTLSVLILSTDTVGELDAVLQNADCFRDLERLAIYVNDPSADRDVAMIGRDLGQILPNVNVRVQR